MDGQAMFQSYQNSYHHHRSWSTGTHPPVQGSWHMPLPGHPAVFESPTVSPTLLQQTISPGMIFTKAETSVPSALPSRSVSPAPQVRLHHRSATIDWPIQNDKGKRVRPATPEEISEEDEAEDSDEHLKRSRCAQACEPCRKRKVKCRDGVPCHRCRKLKKDCIFADTPTAQQRVANARSRALSNHKDLPASMLNPNVPMRPNGIRLKIRKRKSPTASPVVPSEPSFMPPQTASAPTLPIPLPTVEPVSPFEFEQFSALGVSLQDFSAPSHLDPSYDPAEMAQLSSSPQAWNALMQQLAIDSFPAPMPVFPVDSASPATSISGSTHYTGVPFGIQMSPWAGAQALPQLGNRRASSELTIPFADLRTPVNVDGAMPTFFAQKEDDYSTWTSFGSSNPGL